MGVVIDGSCAGFAAASVLLTEGMTVVKWPYALTTQIPCNISSSCQQIAGPSSTSRRRAGPATCAMPTIRLMQRSAWPVRQPIRICPAEQHRAMWALHFEQQQRRRPPRVKVVQAVVQEVVQAVVIPQWQGQPLLSVATVAVGLASVLAVHPHLDPVPEPRQPSAPLLGRRRALQQVQAPAIAQVSFCMCVCGCVSPCAYGVRRCGTFGIPCADSWSWGAGESSRIRRGPSPDHGGQEAPLSRPLPTLLHPCILLSLSVPQRIQLCIPSLSTGAQ